MTWALSKIGQVPRLILLTVLLTGGLLTQSTTCLAAGSAPVSVSAILLSKSQCKFSTATAVLSFGNLDPANPVDVSATTTLNYVCRGSAPIATYVFSDDDGLYESGPDANQMQHATLAGFFLPYSISLSPPSGTVPRNTAQTLTVTGTVLGADYQTAEAGAYADTLTITIAP